MPEAGYTKRRNVWTPEEVVAAFREWQERYGEPPTATDWAPGDCAKQARRSAERARAWSARGERFYEGEYPWPGTVWKLFGGWNKALGAAGLEVRYQRKAPCGLKLTEPSNLGSDSLRGLVDEIEHAMVVGASERMRRSLCELAENALAWAQDLPEGGDDLVVAEDPQS